MGSGICEGVRGMASGSFRCDAFERVRFASGLTFGFMLLADREDTGFFLFAEGAGTGAVSSSSSSASDSCTFGIPEWGPFKFRIEE